MSVKICHQTVLSRTRSLWPENAPLGNWPALRAAGPKSARGKRRDTVEILYASMNPHRLELRF